MDDIEVDIEIELEKREAEVMAKMSDSANLTNIEQDYINSFQLSFQTQLQQLVMEVDKGNITMEEYTQEMIKLVRRMYKSIESVVGVERTVLFLGSTLEETLEALVPNLVKRI